MFTQVGDGEKANFLLLEERHARQDRCPLLFLTTERLNLERILDTTLKAGCPNLEFQRSMEARSLKRASGLVEVEDVVNA